MIDEKDIRFERILGEGNCPSKAQLDIVDFVVHRLGNATVQSRAGSGKSKTIELVASFIPKDKKVLVISYNRHIAQHLKGKFGGMPNVDVRTYHSLGLKILSTKLHKSFDESSINENKYKDYLLHNIDKLSNYALSNLNVSKRLTYKKNIEALIGYARYNKAQSTKEIIKIADKYSITCFLNECEAVKNILKWGNENIETIDYTDMVWLPYELGITGNMPSLLYDFILIDEAQDSSLIQQNLLNICKKRTTRFIAFGDAKQTINSWCGSDENAFNNFSKQPNTRTFHLNMSYRCSKAVAEYVKRYVPDFTVPDSAMKGSVNYSVSVNKINKGDLVLCRMTAPLIKLHLKLLDEGKPSKVNGIGLGADLLETVASVNTSEIDELINILYQRLMTVWGKLTIDYGCSFRDAATENSVINLYDEIISIETLSKDLSTVEELKARINEIFDSVTKEDADYLDDKHIHLSTIHRAKGLEAENVFILCPSLMPSRLVNKDWEIEAEDNLIYVAWSRAKKSLNFIDEKEFPCPCGYNNGDELYKELSKKKEKYQI